MKKILFLILAILTMSSCSHLGRGNEFIVIQVTESHEYSNYPYFVKMKSLHAFGQKEYYIYTSSKYFVGDTLILIKKQNDKLKD